MSDRKQKDKSDSKLTAAPATGRTTGNAAASSNRTLGPAAASSGLSTTASSHCDTDNNTDVTSSNIVLDCAMKGDAARLKQCFEDAADPYHDSVASLINSRGTEDGRSPLEWSSLLGNEAVVTELIVRGAEVNAVTEKGYTASHLAAAWGQVHCLKVLVDSGADMELKNSFDERPRDIAVRYAMHQCINYMDWADARQNLKNFILSVKEQFAGIDKMKALSKEDKATVTNLITEKTTWLEKLTTDVSADEVIMQQAHAEDVIAAINQKLAEEAENKPQKGSKKAK